MPGNGIVSRDKCGDGLEVGDRGTVGDMCQRTVGSVGAGGVESEEGDTGAGVGGWDEGALGDGVGIRRVDHA